MQLENTATEDRTPREDYQCLNTDILAVPTEHLHRRTPLIETCVGWKVGLSVAK